VQTFSGELPPFRISGKIHGGTGYARRISADEAIEILKRANREGLVHTYILQLLEDRGKDFSALL
jgi:hypothetical protein